VTTSFCVTRHTLWSIWSSRKLVKLVLQTSDFKAKMYQNQFRLGLCPRPRWGSLQRSPRPPSCIWGPTSKGKEGEGEERREREGEGKGKGTGEGKGREGGKTTLHSPCRKFLATPLKLSKRVSFVASNLSDSEHNQTHATAQFAYDPQYALAAYAGCS